MILFKTPVQRGVKSQDTWKQQLKALKAISEWRLVSSGAASYKALGYVSDGQVWAVKLLQFLIIDSIVTELTRQAGK